MGFLKEVLVTIIKYAPLKDPLELLLKNYHLTLRWRKPTEFWWKRLPPNPFDAGISLTNRSSQVTMQKPTNVQPAPPEHEQSSGIPESAPKKLTIVLAGNPNSGKTSIFNMLTGARQKVGNWGGVTVDFKVGSMKYGSQKIELVDLPGTYSLTALSLEEEVARDFIIKEQPDVVINVVDSSNLERNLYLTVQLMELGVNMVLAFNMSDEAEKNGMEIDVKGLSALLQAPIVKTVGRTGVGMKELIAAAVKRAEHPREAGKARRATFPGKISDEINSLSALLTLQYPNGKYPPPGWPSSCWKMTSR